MKSITLKIVQLDHAKNLPLPTYQSEDASGMDAVAAVASPLEIAPKQTALVPTGLKMAVPSGYEIQVRPRSGLALKHGIFVVNSPGTIDADYRGEINVILGNFSDRPFVINRGDRIAQLVIQEVIRADCRVVEELDTTERGEKGFGSTGK